MRPPVEAVTNNPLPSRERLPSLDGLRALSIGLVVLGHSMATVQWFPRLFPTTALIIGNSELGVSIFFVISGYLITRLLLDELESSGRISFYNFYVRRITRIIPAFYCYLFVIGALAISGWLTIKPIDFLLAATFTWNYLPFGTGSWWLGQTWSLCIEEQFYILWPAILFLLNRERATRLAQIIIVAEPVIRVASYIWWPAYRSRIPVMLHTRADVLMFGCLLALQHNKGYSQPWLDRLSRPLPLTAIACFLFVLEPLLARHFRGLYVLPVGLTLEAASITVIVFALLKPSPSALFSLFNSSGVNWVGKRSYGLYLWQQAFLTPLNTNVSGIFPINVLAAVSASAVSFRYIEKPAIQYRTKWLRQTE